MTHLILTHLHTQIMRLRHERPRNTPVPGPRGVDRHPDAGYTTETIAVIALLVILALAVIGIIAAKVIAKANGITL